MSLIFNNGGKMTNPNNNKNFNDEALKINRALKKKLDKANEIVKVLIYFEQDRMSTSGQQSLDELKETLS